MYNHDKSAGYNLCSIIRMSHDPRDHTPRVTAIGDA